MVLWPDVTISSILKVFLPTSCFSITYDIQKYKCSRNCYPVLLFPSLFTLSNPFPIVELLSCLGGKKKKKALTEIVKPFGFEIQSSLLSVKRHVKYQTGIRNEGEMIKQQQEQILCYNIFHTFGIEFFILSQ